ncbi:Hypothetical predicted protein [Marmota monax]|uniref:Uncharacterized protein n=1 Tax=Marmota monax TaxID=9995 RepID=A0A5E4A5Y3_MARMO|nr:Hypothetical predicted protein [Marmota monax]
MDSGPVRPSDKCQSHWHVSREMLTLGQHSWVLSLHRVKIMLLACAGGPAGLWAQQGLQVLSRLRATWAWLAVSAASGKGTRLQADCFALLKRRKYCCIFDLNLKTKKPVYNLHLGWLLLGGLWKDLLPFSYEEDFTVGLESGAAATAGIPTSEVMCSCGGYSLPSSCTCFQPVSKEAWDYCWSPESTACAVSFLTPHMRPHRAIWDPPLKGPAVVSVDCGCHTDLTPPPHPHAWPPPGPGGPEPGTAGREFLCS